MSETAFLERRSLTPRSAGGDSTQGRAARGKTLPKESLLTAKGFGRPPIRIPVIPENRGVLRELRARELELWDGRESAQDGKAVNRVDAGREDRESQLILLLLGGAALAMWLQATTAAVRFVQGWEVFRAWVAAVLG